jgi:3-oxoacyl-[acyl-carrier protein] reductase
MNTTPMNENSIRNVIVTGASRGIGLAVATLLASRGYGIVACSRSRSEELDALLSTHPSVDFIPLDLADAESVKACAQRIHKDQARIDGLVNVAGISSGGLFSMTRMEDIKRVFEVNYFNQILFTQYVAKKMMRAKVGAIVNIASIAGMLADAGTLAYGGSKAALIHATCVLATELGPFGIRVNAIAPAVVETAMANEMDPAARTAMDARSALSGIVSAGDVAELVAFLVSDASAKMTGQVLRLDRGLH